MESFLHTLKVIGLILVVIFSFNVIIFVHELGHFLAARWRGLVVDRFQIWFGKPIWKKTINGVQYGLGWIPAGGFVALPQMAPMESIEGENSGRDKPLDPIKPIDKIIVAFAGPLFSFLLALFAAVVVYFAGKPANFEENQVVGYVEKDSPAAVAGLKEGDKITEINGSPVDGFYGNLDAITESIIFSKGDELHITVERPGEGELYLTSGFEVDEGGILKRDGVRRIGIAPEGEAIVGGVFKGGPAEFSGFKAGDKLLSVNGEDVLSIFHFSKLIKENGDKPSTVKVLRDGEEIELKTMALVPSNGYQVDPTKDPQPMIGITWQGYAREQQLVYPSPLKQISDSGRMLFVTIDRLTTPKSGIKLEHLSGPVGIGKMKYQILLGDFPLRQILYFWVIFNINLAIFNMLPFPVLDGGHITMALAEMIRKKPLNTQMLEVVQTGFVLVLLGTFVFITMKDSFSGMGAEAPERKGPKEPEFDLTTLKALTASSTN
ncbi:regulator of sigma E protease [Rubritalea squalenifaciens DSM 18772]|uniref:Zinc metalloprotease n=1 Tax=Rubritalea squalenifaciens DSM 18772 TaxID=1123071 RepID=A0A1M6BIG2_9BACT|nr:RIP metalloprotease RseP [Rubritalea squalenifaciens]SHI48501.1 regulator of sigma E protease [Rubritalea squalenifaciens DSM 18772]